MKTLHFFLVALIMALLAVTPATAQISGTVTPDSNNGGRVSVLSVVTEYGGTMKVLAEIRPCVADDNPGALDGCLTPWGDFSGVTTSDGSMFPDGDIRIIGVGPNRTFYGYGQVNGGTAFVAVESHETGIEIVGTGWSYNPTRDGTAVNLVLRVKQNQQTAQYGRWIAARVSFRSASYNDVTTPAGKPLVYYAKISNNPNGVQLNNPIVVLDDVRWINPTRSTKVIATVELIYPWGPYAYSKTEETLELPPVWNGWSSTTK